MNELDRIKAEAVAAESSAAPAGAIAESGGAALDQAALDQAEVEGWAQLPATFGSILCMALPELRAAYSDANCRAWGEAMYAVAKKHGWTVKDIGPWLGLAVATVPFAVPTVIAVRARRLARDGSSAGGASSVTSRDVTDQAAEAAAASRPGRVSPVG